MSSTDTTELLRKLEAAREVLAELCSDLADVWGNEEAMPFFELRDRHFRVPSGGRRKVTDLVFIVQTGPIEHVP